MTSDDSHRFCPKPPVFTREATGLVREIGGSEYAMTAMNGVVPLASLVLTPWWIWFAAPGADALSASILGFLFSIFGAIPVYAMLSATFPRSAAPYVATSRVLHPALGWPAEVLAWVAWITSFALYPSFMITWGLIPGFYTMGISTGNSALVSAAFALTNPWVDLGVGLVFFALSLPIALVRTRSLVRTFQYPVTIIMFISMFVIVGILAQASTAQLNVALSKYLASNVTSIMSSARTSYPVAMMPPTFALIPLLAATAFTAGSFNTYWSAWASGEVKRGSQVTMQILTMILPAVIIILFVGSSIFVAQATLGRDFLVAFTQILSLNPGFFSSAPPMPSYVMTLLPMILADNPAVQFLIMLGIICAVLAYLPATWLVTSRQWFAWSFDRLIPSKFSEVSDRFHTPIWSVVANFAAGLIFLVIFTFFIQYLGFFTTASWDISFVPIALVNIAGIVIPLRKNLWSLSPANKYSIGGVPLISVFGLIGLFFNGAAMVVYTVTPILGYGLPSTALILTSFVIPFVLYWVIRYVRKSQGIDLGIVFRSVPPE